MEVTPFQAWFFAIRPKTLTVALVSVAVGLALAAVEGSYSWKLGLLMLISSCLIQIGSNLVNDAADFRTGADTGKRLGFPRATQMGWLKPDAVMRAAGGCFFAACVLAFPLIQGGGAVVAALLLLSILAAYGYSAGPFPLAYHGLGELFVMLFFGGVCTGVAYFTQAGRYSVEALLAGVQTASLATALIAINNVRDRESDLLAGKKTLAVRFGEEFGKWEMTFWIALPFLLNAFWATLGWPVASFLPYSVTPFALTILFGLWKNKPGTLFNGYFVLTALLHILFGALLTVGILLKLLA